MTQYLVTTFKNSAGQLHEYFTTARDNQALTVVETESREETERKYEAQVKVRGGGDARESDSD